MAQEITTAQILTVNEIVKEALLNGSHANIEIAKDGNVMIQDNKTIHWVDANGVWTSL